MIKAVIFDMDGVLVDTESFWSEADREFLKRRGINYRDEFKAEVMGRSLEATANFYKNKFNLKESTDRITEERLKILRGLYKEKLSPMPGALTLITNLHKNGYILALASGSPIGLINTVLKKLDLGKYFSAKISGESVKKGKPAPEIYLTTAKKIKIKPLNCLVIEDAPSGVSAAKKAGMYCVAVFDKRYSKKEDVIKADLIVESLREINSETIDNLSKSAPSLHNSP